MSFTYTGFKLGEKKLLKDKESFFHTNSERIMKALNTQEADPMKVIRIDWAAFSNAVTSENMRPYLGDAVYDRWCGGIATDLESFLQAQPNCSSLLSSSVHHINLSCKEECVNPGEISLTDDGSLNIVVNGKRTGNNYELGFVPTYLNDHLHANVSTYPEDLSGFTLREAKQIAGDLHYLTKANETLHKVLPNLSISVDFGSFAKHLSNPEHRKYAGEHVCEWYCGGIAGEISSLCQENTDAAEAMAAIKSIIIDCDAANGSVGSSSHANEVTLKNDILRITVNPAKLGYRYIIGTVRTFLEANL